MWCACAAKSVTHQYSQAHTAMKMRKGLAPSRAWSGLMPFAMFRNRALSYLPAWLKISMHLSMWSSWPWMARQIRSSSSPRVHFACRTEVKLSMCASRWAMERLTLRMMIDRYRTTKEKASGKHAQPSPISKECDTLRPATYWSLKPRKCQKARPRPWPMINNSNQYDDKVAHAATFEGAYLAKQRIEPPRSGLPIITNTIHTKG
mmetsp:Transcript_64511/g.210337  ORF Transcript_64511/g.210337 Transcript_64511/m.210337 type:complete len:205 (-) Transcript_64511:1033-1647(-)